MFLIVDDDHAAASFVGAIFLAMCWHWRRNADRRQEEYGELTAVSVRCAATIAFFF